ncbi:YchJ family protein [Phytomonospora endophytica]|uniref:SEC-C motif-containing protein n=1 Tax=Phytomonospora endophytica TaxID=714109 RepID=A0A841G2D6_9ACTN|nr:YchJ family metal-binding protein [Phytomonospora endophytica]MBB6038859.1 SEC-C motif-containing protein [Phytomonospora endophytica]GIG68346.1 UPF0225 protein [Phytomonospora endophytica]
MSRPTSPTCPCGFGTPYGDCCGRWRAEGPHAPTAELLMRSRFTAFARGDAPYLQATWHPLHRPARLNLGDSPRFTRLEIVATRGGGMLDTAGTVHFRAHYTDGTTPGVLEENSSFVREGGRWLYVAAIG